MCFLLISIFMIFLKIKETCYYDIVCVYAVIIFTYGLRSPARHAKLIVL